MSMNAAAKLSVMDPVFRKEDEKLIRIYEEAFPIISKIVCRFGGSMDDARDIFHDALIILLEKENERQQLLLSEKAYLIGIAKKIAIRRFNARNATVSLKDSERQIELPVDFYPTVNDRRLLRFLEITGRKCLDLLRAFYYSMLPVSEIAIRHGYANEHSASVQKYKCLNKLKMIVQEKSLQYEDFME